ncbi:CocE/NonD family hydrolase [Nocardia sp. NPDC052316]|uniref:CocE/NonD family hydrolase n=1 Tax=Nocardia sp. NPDC052316 TaxID=3364329 RepID=UPI0037C61898
MVRGTVAALTVAFVMPFITPTGSAETGTEFLGLDAGPLGAQWQAAVDGPQPYDGISPDLAIPLTMSDGTVLKADVLHPMKNGIRSEAPGPVVLSLDGYGKVALTVAQMLLQLPGLEQMVLPFLERVIGSVDLTGTALEGITDLTQQADSGLIEAAAVDPRLVRAGYTIVHVDIRGTGTSEGRWQVFGEKERQDTREIAAWITAQPWSDGNIGTAGTSFMGLSALRAVDSDAPAIKAVFGVVPSGDTFDDITFRGGGFGVGFLPLWLLATNLAKMVPDVEAIIAGRFDPVQQQKWLADRLADPATYLDMVANLYTALHPDQFSDRTREFADPDSSGRRGLTVNASEVSAATFVVTGWFDIFGSSQTTTWSQLGVSPAKKKYVIGDGYHAGGGVAGFGRNGMPRLDTLQRAWFDKWLRGIDNGVDKFAPLTMKQPGGTWTTSDTFPRKGTGYQRMYLTDRPSGTAPGARYDGGLSRNSPTAGRDLTVAPGLASLCSRDTATSLAGIPSIIVGCTEDSRIRETEGLTFTSSPVTEPTAVSGPINIHLNVSHEAADGYWVVTVNDVAPDGQSRQISAGQLVSSMRAIDDSRSDKSANGDYIRPVYYIDLDKRQLTVPGEPMTLDIGSDPIDTTLQPGHRLRVDIFASNFPKGLPPLAVLNDSQLKPQHLQLDPDAPSWMNVALSQPIPE